MNTKLTLSLDKDIITKAKQYAKSNNISLSSLIENYLLMIITDPQKEKIEKGNITDELSGIITLEDNFNYKDELNDYLTQKYK